MNSIFEIFMESQILWISSGFTLTLQETRSIPDSMNIPKTEFISYIKIIL